MEAPKWYRHLKTINRHKWMVMKNCFRCGLYKQGLLHDLSKYSWTEFSVGARYFQGTRSPNDAEKKRGILARGCITKAGISIIWNIG